MKRVLLSFATPEYREVQNRLAGSAKHWFDEIVKLGTDDLGLEFMRKNARLLSYRRGFGYWSWKSFCIRRQLEAMAPEDSLWYSDSQCVFESNPAPVFDLVRKHDGIGIFHQKREKHRNSRWTRGDCFKVMGCDEPKYRNGDNLLATYSAWNKTDRSMALLLEWEKWSSTYEAVSDEPSGPTNSYDFIDHRQDQSILSILAIRDNLFTLCDCSQWGDGYRCEECRYPRILRTDRRVMPLWMKRPTMSSIIEISTVAACPMRCSYCPQDKLEAAYAGPKELTLDVFTKCLGNLVPGDAIYFAGFTEPCLNPKIIEMIELSLKTGHRTQLYTTGRGLTSDKARQISGMGLEKIVLHLPDAYGHLSHSQSNIGVLDALSRHPDVEVMAMDGEPHSDVRYLLNGRTVNHGAMHDRAGNVTVQLTMKKQGLGGPIKCGAAPGLDHPVLLPDGRLALCCMDYSLQNIVGNLAMTPYSEIVRGVPIEKLHRLQMSGHDIICRHCTCAVPA